MPSLGRGRDPGRRRAHDLKLNLACSGAETANVFSAAAGGQSFKGEPPQTDQLGWIAKARNVKLIVLSIGGNDLGFASIVQDCITAYLSFSPPCDSTHERPFNQAFVGVLGRVDKAIKDIRGVMLRDGYARLLPLRRSRAIRRPCRAPPRTAMPSATRCARRAGAVRSTTATPTGPATSARGSAAASGRSPSPTTCSSST